MIQGAIATLHPTYPSLPPFLLKDALNVTCRFAPLVLTLRMVSIWCLGTPGLFCQQELAKILLPSAEEKVKAGIMKLILIVVSLLCAVKRKMQVSAEDLDKVIISPDGVFD